MSDDFSVYVNNRVYPRTSKIIQNMPHKNFWHRWVNHSMRFVDPFDSNIHINTIERLWKDLRPNIKSSKNVEEIYIYLMEYTFYGI